MLMALGAAGFVWLAYRRGAFAEPPSLAAAQP
jgi:hypothetical protein